MADLSVKIEYASDYRKVALQTMRMLFPVWGIIPALAMIWALINLSVCMIVPVGNLFALTILLFISSAIIILSLLTIRFLEKSQLLIDKNGIELPFEFAMNENQKYLAWKDIKRAVATTEVESDDWKKRKLIFFDANDI